MIERTQQEFSAAYQEAVAEALSMGQPEDVAHTLGVSAAACGSFVANPPQAAAGPAERRRLTRHPGTGLVAHFDGMALDVVDISLGGIRLIHSGEVRRGELRFQLVKRGADGRMAGAPAIAEPVYRRGRDLHMRFVGMNYPLAQLIVEHIGSVSGVRPYIFR